MNEAPVARTKIVATLGPATSTPDVVERLLLAGVNVVRLNFSHGTRQEHAERLELVRSTAERLGMPIAVIGDLCGPKIRLLEVKGGTVEVATGHHLRIVREPVLGNAERVAVNRPELFDDAEVGHRILIDDGAVRFHVVSKEADGLTCRCYVGGAIGSRKGLNLPDTDLTVTALTDKDRDDARWAAEAKLEYLALSFVRRAEDVESLRRLLDECHADCHIISKIETRHALDHLDAIIGASHAVLVARGDLGVEVDVATLPRLQKDMIARCRRAGKPVIVATQMLQSMVAAPTPTRAEVSDVANAIYDGADAVMLSAETAVGRFPLAAVETMRHIAVETDAHGPSGTVPIEARTQSELIAAAAARAICNVADDVAAKAVVVRTRSGWMARLLSKFRLSRPVIALTPNESVRRRIALYFGIIPLQADYPSAVDSQIAQADRILIEGRWAEPGDLIVIGLGPRAVANGDSGSIIIHSIDHDDS